VIKTLLKVGSRYDRTKKQIRVYIYVRSGDLEGLLRVSFMEVCEKFPSKQIFFLYPLIVLRTIPFPGDKELDKRISSSTAYPRV
jgi:hypothetical protein